MGDAPGWTTGCYRCRLVMRAFLLVYPERASASRDPTMALEEYFKDIVGVIALGIEAAAVVVVTVGAVQAFVRVVGLTLRGEPDLRLGRDIWLSFAVWIALALEFALAADLIRTAIAVPTGPGSDSSPRSQRSASRSTIFSSATSTRWEPEERARSGPESRQPRSCVRRQWWRLQGKSDGERSRQPRRATNFSSGLNAFAIRVSSSDPEGDQSLVWAFGASEPRGDGAPPCLDSHPDSRRP